MNMTCPETTPVVGAFPPHVMEPLHAELAGRAAALLERLMQAAQ